MRSDELPFEHPWEQGPISDYATVIVGGTPSTEIPEFWGGDVLWMASGDVHLGKIRDVPGRITQKGLAHSNAVVVNPKAVAIALAGQGKTRGTVALTYVPICTNQSVALIKPHDEKLDPEFLYQSLIPRYDELRSRSAGGGRAGLSKGILDQTPVQVPPIQQQTRIAEILSTVDEAIEQTEALIAKTRQIKAGLMHDLFTRGVTPDGQLRPPREEAPQLYKESPLGWIPKEWDVERLGDILKRCGGYLQTGPFGSQLHAHEYRVEGVPVVMPQDINHGQITTNQIAHITENRAQILGRHRMKPGDIVIARRGELSRAASISSSEQGWVCGTGCFLLRLEQSALMPKFASYCYRQDFVQRQIVARAVGTTMPNLNNAVMAQLRFPFCDEGEQTRIIERIRSVEDEQSIGRESLKVFRNVKAGLMSNLLNGDVEVSA